MIRVLELTISAYLNKKVRKYIYNYKEVYL